MFPQKYKYYLLGLLTIVAVLFWWVVWEGEKPAQFQVVFFDVGQGDSIFIEDEERHQILIDGGEGKAVLSKLGKAMPFFDRSLDAVILTHPNRDHLGGLIEVLERYKVDRVIYNGVESDDEYYKRFKEIIAKKNIAVSFPRYGEHIMLANNTRLDFLFPLEDLKDKKVKDLNNTSIVCRLARGEKEYLLMGDAGQDEEAELISNNVYLKSDVLKVGHHGSKNSTSENFLKAVEPQAAIISVGKNTYGHPNEAILGRLQDLGAQILRTDERGDISY